MAAEPVEVGAGPKAREGEVGGEADGMTRVPALALTLPLADAAGVGCGCDRCELPMVAKLIGIELLSDPLLPGAGVPAA